MGLDMVTLLVRSTHFDTNAVSCYMELLKHFIKPATRLKVDQEIDGKMT